MNRFCVNCMEPLGEGEVCQSCGFCQSDYHAEAHQLAPGVLLRDRYEIGRVLGEGGFGITYVGKDTVLERKVAVKEFYMSGYVNRNCTVSTDVLSSAGTQGETFEKNKEKFLIEARVLAKFDDEGIVNIRDFFQENNTAYIVMDFLSGETLRDYIKRIGKLTTEEIVSILEPVLQALSSGQPVLLYEPGLPQVKANRSLAAALASKRRELKNWGVVFTDGGQRKVITAAQAQLMQQTGERPAAGAVLTPLAKEILNL